MLKSSLLSSVAAVVLICAAPVAMAQSSHDQKAKTGQEMSRPQHAGQQHESNAAQQTQKGDEARSTQASENKAAHAADKNTKAPRSQARPSTTGQSTHEEPSPPSKDTGLNDRAGKAAPEAQKAPENSSKSIASKQAQPANKAAQTPGNKAAQAPAASTTGKQTGEAKASGQTAPKNAVAPQNSGTASNNSARPSNSTTDKVQVQGGDLSTEQRTKITQVSQSIVSRNDAPRISNPDFSVSIGTVIPTHVHYVRVPETLVEVYPQWRDDNYFVVNDEIVIVDHSRRIVAVVPAGSARASRETVVDLSPAEVREVQTVLIERGYLHGRADGEWGPRTRDALITFQRKEGVEATGHIDERTVQSLGLSGKIKTGSIAGANEKAGSRPENASSGIGPSTTSGADRNATPARGTAGSANGNANDTSKGNSPKATTGQGSTNGAPPASTEQKRSAEPTNDQGTISKTGNGKDRHERGTK